MEGAVTRVAPASNRNAETDHAFLQAAEGGHISCEHPPYRHCSCAEIVVTKTRLVGYHERILGAVWPIMRPAAAMKGDARQFWLVSRDGGGRPP